MSGIEIPMKFYHGPGGSDLNVLRDWFAGMAMQGIMAAKANGSPAWIAILSYDQADAMLAEKAKREEG